MNLPQLISFSNSSIHPYPTGCWLSSSYFISERRNPLGIPVFSPMSENGSILCLWSGVISPNRSILSWRILICSCKVSCSSSFLFNFFSRLFFFRVISTKLVWNLFTLKSLLLKLRLSVIKSFSHESISIDFLISLWNIGKSFIF